MQACAGNKTLQGYYCETVSVQQLSCAPKNDICTTYVCQNGLCVPNFKTCAVTGPCQTGVCSLAAGGCIYSDPCTGATIADKCRAPRCVLDATLPNGFMCDDPTSPARDCTDYRCSAVGVPSRTLLGAAAMQQFLSQYQATANGSCVEVVCTADSCDPTTGCVNQVMGCTVATDSCNATLGCFEPRNTFNYPPGQCLEQVIQSLIDFCGVCHGDNIACFFTSINQAAVAGGIAGGVVAGITIAAVVAALLAVWACKKGYDYYQASAAMQSASVQLNPYFTENTNAGEMPTLGTRRAS